MAQPDLLQQITEGFRAPWQFLLAHQEDVVGVITGAPATVLTLFTLTVMGTWFVAALSYRWRMGNLRGEVSNLNSRLQQKDEEIAKLTKEEKELTAKLQSVTAKLDEYAREYAWGFHPTIEQVVNCLLALDDIMRKVPIKIVATLEARSFAEQLIIALTRIGYGVLPHAEQIHGIVPARTPRNKMIVRYEEKATDQVHNCLCRDMSAALQHILTHKVQLFPENGGKDYFQIELLGEP